MIHMHTTRPNLLFSQSHEHTWRPSARLITSLGTSLGSRLKRILAILTLGLATTATVISTGAELIGTVDYRDTFTINNIRTDGLYNNNSNRGYDLEQTFGNPPATWTPLGNFSFGTPGSTVNPPRVGAATGNSGAESGLAQSGGGDFSFTYGLRNSYVVQADAILPTDRLDFTSLPNAGGGIGAQNSLNVFLRRDSVTSLPGIGLYNGATETGVTDLNGSLVRTGVDDDNWHNFAVHFDQTNNLLKVYVDGVLIATVDLTTFAGGIYQNYSSGAVGMGGAGGVFWMDNFVVGGTAISTNTPPTVSLTAPTNGANFTVPATFTVTSIATNTDGSITKVDFYADASLIATATAPPYSVSIKVQSTGTLTLTAIATDIRGQVATSAPVAVTITGSLPPVPLTVNNGLQLWLKADAGVTADASGSISVWADQSPNGNNASQDNALATPPVSFQPMLVANALNGKPVIHFDGVDDFMQIPNAPSLQPQSGDWTVFFIAQRGTPSRGDFPQIIGSRPWNAGADKGWAVCFSRGSGLVASHYADGVLGHDVPAIQSSTPLSTSIFQVWQVEENRSASFTRFYLLGQTNQTLQTTMPTSVIDQPNDIFIGSEVDGADTRRGNIDLAEILVYNRVLSEADRDAVTTHLLRKYAVKQIFSANTPPTVSLTGPTNGTTFNAPANITLTANAADSDGRVVRVEFFKGTSSLGVVTNSPYLLPVSISSLGDVTLTAVGIDNLGARTTSDPVTIKVIRTGAELIGKVDYSDTFTTNAIRLDGLYNNNANGAYNIEDRHGNAPATWSPLINFSFNTPASSVDPTKLRAAQGNTGANSGFAQSGGGDFSIPYGLQSNFVVRVDAILPTDRLDITSLPNAGGGIGAQNSLSVFLRRDSLTSLPGIGLYNAAMETGVTDLSGSFVRTGVNDNNWHNYAVNFDKISNLLKVYVDGVLIATVNLTTFAGGIYQNYSNGAVSMGGAGGVFWMDNFKVGAPPKLIATVDYRDTFSISDIRPDPLYNDNSGGGYNLEQTFGNPPATWTPLVNFSFGTPGSSVNPPRVDAATGNSGAESGLAQSGGGDFSFTYGLRNSYVVQADAILPIDRLDITSLPNAGGGIGAQNSLSVFLRRDSLTSLPGIGLYNGATETGVTNLNGSLVRTGVGDNNWHNFAMHFDQINNLLKVYVDGVLIATVDLTTFAGGIYQNYSNGAVGMGGTGGVFWMDNFVVGEPEAALQSPASLSIGRQQGNVVISWTAVGTLEEATTIKGSWTTAAGAASPSTSPFTVTPTDQQKFYRLRQ